MATKKSKPISITKFQGIASSEKEGLEGEYYFGRSIDYRTEAKKISLLPRTVKNSGNVVTDLVKWGQTVSTDTYFYGDTGNIYNRTSSSTWTNPHQASDSHGNGLFYWDMDKYLYYTTDTTIGRYGQIGNDPKWTDDFIGTEGGVPLNTNSLDLEAGDEEYASVADSASLSIVGEMCIEAWIKPESLPTSGNYMVIASKWDESGTTQSYRFDIGTSTAYFGDGSDGALTISTDTTEAPIDSACTGTSGTTSLTATNASFAAGQVILIHQTTGTNAGQWERNKIQSYTAGTITTENNLKNTYTTGAQVRVLKQYTNVTINSGKTYTAKAWNGTVGGILAFLANGTVTVNGAISANAKGYRDGGTGYLNNGTYRDPRYNNTIACSIQGEGDSGTGSYYITANGSGGGGALDDSGNNSGGGGGGGHATEGSLSWPSGTTSYGNWSHSGMGRGYGGGTSGSADLTTMTFGGAGGTGGVSVNTGKTTPHIGGHGGGALFIAGATITMGAAGSMTATGEDGEDGTDSLGGGGAGAGGSILLKAQTATLGTTLITASGGTGGSEGYYGGAGGNGGNGRIHLDYYTSYTGTTSPTLDVTQDDSLATNDGYQLRFGVSDDGDDTEYMTKDAELETDKWQHVAVSWNATTSTSTFYLNGVSLGTSTGTMTEIDDNASAFLVGAFEDSGGDKAGFYDGLIDELRIWNSQRTATQIVSNKEFEQAGTEAYLNAYWQFDEALTDSGPNSNDLTHSDTATYSTDVPFSHPTTRQDLDQSLDTSGNTYTVPTTITESAANYQEFVPDKEPQKSVEVNINATGTGDWTLTVHDVQNKTMATQTVEVEDLNTGDYEFIFDSTWTPVIGQTYHFHLTSTVADGTVVTTTASNLNTADFHTYFQILINDDDFHPITEFLDFIVIGNGKYVATWDGVTYTSNKIQLESGYKVRCFATWGEYLAIGAWRGSNIYSSDKGKVYFWDGVSDTYNFVRNIPEGNVNSMTELRGVLYIIAGYRGGILEFNGGQFEKVKEIPKLATDEYMEVAAGGVDVWRSLVHIGVSYNTDSSTLEQGVYSFGTTNKNYSESLGYDYPISTGRRTETTLRIGCVFAQGQDLFIGWKDGSGYGVDIENAGNDPYPTGTYEALITDVGMIYHEKKQLLLRAEYEELNDGESVNLGYKNDRESTWNTTTADTTENSIQIRFPLTKNWKETQFKVDLATTTTTSPKLLGITLEVDPLPSEGMEVT